jgi:hypothetical protein
MNELIAESAAIQLLAESRLGLDGESFRDPIQGEIQWAQVRAVAAFSASEQILIALAEDLTSGVLGAAVIGLDETNWRALMVALQIARCRR